MRMRKLLALLAGGVLLAIIVELLGGLAVEHLGLFDVSASTAHPNVVRQIVHRTMVQSVERQATATAPRQVEPRMLVAGLCAYRDHCESCHGGPAVARSAWANGLYPTPPYLIDARNRWTPSQLHWIVSNGIKMTAMPAWRASMADRDIWNVVAFLDALPRLSGREYAETAASMCGETVQR
jgi:mono/diheme cytochrome c family protein